MTQSRESHSGAEVTTEFMSGSTAVSDLHVLHVLDHSLPLQSGYTFRTLAILGRQRQIGWRTTQLTGPKQGWTDLAEEQVDGWRFHRTPSRPTGVRVPGWKYWAIIRALERRLEGLVREVEPDIIHAHSPLLNAVAAIRVGNRLGVPVVYEVRAFWEDAAVDHGTTREGSARYRLTRAVETWALRRADAVTCICEGLRGEIVSRGVPEANVTVIPNAVDPARFSVDLPRDPGLGQSLGLSDGPIIGFIGSFYGYEGLDLAIAAMPILRERHPNAMLLLVGGGPQEENLRQQVRSSGVESSVIFTGRVPHERVEHYYGLIDVLVYPRRSMRLTELVTPLKPLEAMARGRLLVASDVGGHRELIRDGFTGRLFAAGDAGALAEAVDGLLEDREHWGDYRENARYFVESDRNWDRSVERYRSVYGGLL